MIEALSPLAADASKVRRIWCAIALLALLGAEMYVQSLPESEYSAWAKATLAVAPASVITFLYVATVSAAQRLQRASVWTRVRHMIGRVRFHRPVTFSAPQQAVQTAAAKPPPIQIPDGEILWIAQPTTNYMWWPYPKGVCAKHPHQTLWSLRPASYGSSEKPRIERILRRAGPRHIQPKWYAHCLEGDGHTLDVDEDEDYQREQIAQGKIEATREERQRGAAR